MDDIETHAKYCYDKSYFGKAKPSWDEASDRTKKIWRNCAIMQQEYQKEFGRRAYAAYQGSPCTVEDFEKLDFLEKVKWAQVASAVSNN